MSQFGAVIEEACARLAAKRKIIIWSSRLAIGGWPLIGSNAVTLALMALILAMKLRYGSHLLRVAAADIAADLPAAGVLDVTDLVVADGCERAHNRSCQPV